MSEWDEEDMAAEFEREEDMRALSPAGVAEQNRWLLRRYREFCRAADAVAAAWRDFPSVQAVALIGSTAMAPFKEMPRFSSYRRAGIALWHECKDVDLALWLGDLDNLDALRRAKNKALREAYETAKLSVADHQVDVFILDPGSNRYRGRLCAFNQCPKGKRACDAPGCGATAFLRQHENFRWRPDALANALALFDRASGAVARAAELPLP
jgi:hypothetical protein